VGGSLLDLLGERAQQLGDAPPIHVDRVLVRDAARARPALAQAIARGIAGPDACITDPTLLLSDDIDVLVEVIGGTTTARTLVEAAVRRGIRVVTANKALLGERGAALSTLARLADTRLDFEGAVCGAIPIVHCVRSGAAGVGITKVSGILNGTSNYVLEQVAEGASLADAVATAQRLGYAEADPTRVTSDDPWARVAGPFNRIVVESESAGSLVFQGPGAGGRATAGAVLADILARERQD
jgi:homoserine dehydrogenase